MKGTNIGKYVIVRRDDDGNPDCRAFVFDEFVNKYQDEFKMNGGLEGANK